MMAASGHERRDVSHNQFRDNAVINQNNVHFHLPHRLARATVVHVIPYPRNDDLVHRQDLIDELNKLLPQTPGFYSAALWGLGGSGKTQIALDYAYRRCDDSKCCVFWVHADSEATFITDYKTIGKKLGVDERLDGSDLLDAVRSSIEAQSRWVIILDNANNLELFGVGCIEGTNESLSRYIPRGSQGTILWTSRDAHIRGTLVGPSRDIKVPPMTRDEATTLLIAARGDTSAVEDAGIDRLLEELQRLPLAVSQAGAYIRRTSMTIKEYLDLLMQGSSRWDLLKMNDFNRHRRPEVSNSVLETWKISTTRIREESESSYRILHVIAYLDSQDIPYELIVAASQYDVGDEDRAEQVPDLEVQRAVMRLVEFSFLDMRRGEGGLRNYEMHKLVQEAVRYGLWVQGRMEMALGKIITGQNRPENGEAYYSSMALQIVDGVFPVSEKDSWARCEKYMTHAIRVGEWAEVSGKEVETSTLLSRVSRFLYDRGRWREKEPVDQRALDLRRQVLGEKHPDTISSMASLAATYHAQGRYDEDERIEKQVLDLRREVLGEKHPDTISSMANLAATYHEQGRYDEAEGMKKQALDLRREVLGEKHPDTIWSIAELAATYHAQGRYDEDERIEKQALDLRREVLGEKHPDTIRSMANLAATYSTQKPRRRTLREVLHIKPRIFKG
ncbi:P-loop containing nucleoside triphosphate hydrolase protein [Trichoderma austrokoningii]